MRNTEVAEAWYHGRRAHSGRMSTDGASIWSYNLLIGITRPVVGLSTNGCRKVGYRYQSPHFVSMTTSQHVGRVSDFADVMEDPPER